jgi:hypothetical protein
LRVKSERLIEGRKWHGRGRGRRAKRQVKARGIGRLWALLRVAYLRMAKESMSCLDLPSCGFITDLQDPDASFLSVNSDHHGNDM